MAGPYFTGQEPSQCGCGCYYPDVTRVQDRTDARVVFCIVHGELRYPHPGAMDSRRLKRDDEWRAGERARLRTLDEDGCAAVA